MRCRRCGRTAACHYWIRPTPGPKSATACRTLQPLLAATKGALRPVSARSPSALSKSRHQATPTTSATQPGSFAVAGPSFRAGELLDAGPYSSSDRLGWDGLATAWARSGPACSRDDGSPHAGAGSTTPLIVSNGIRPASPCVIWEALRFNAFAKEHCREPTAIDAFVATAMRRSLRTCQNWPCG
jgi:hypothetical protein